MTAETFSSAPRDNNQPSNVTNVSLMYDGGISIESYSAGAGRDAASMVDNEQLVISVVIIFSWSTEIHFI